MAYFTNLPDAIRVNYLAFPVVTNSSMQIFNCKSGERAGFRILNLPQVDGTTVQLSQIYDISTGTPVLKGTISVVKNMDLCGGLFSSGCWCDGDDPLVDGVKFSQVDYV